MTKGRSYTFHDGTTVDNLTDAEYAEAVKFDEDNRPTSLSAGQSVAKFGADVLPALTGTMGTIAGSAGGPAGAFLGGTAAATMGGVGREAIYNAAKIPHDSGFGGTASRLALDAFTGGLGAGLQTLPMLGASKVGAMAPAVEKAAIGNAAPGAEDLMLKWKISADNGGVKMAQKLASAAMDKRKALLDAAEARGWGVSFKFLRGAVRSTAKKYAENDLLSTAGEEALKRAEKVLMGKIGVGPQVGTEMVESAAGKIIGPSGKPVASRAVYGPPAKLTPSRLEQIKEFAQGEAKKLYEARSGMKDVRPSEMEKAYEAIAAEAKSALERISGVKQANEAYRELMVAKEAAFNAAKRSTGYRAIAGAVPFVAGAGHAALTGNGAEMLGVLPASLASAAMLSPGNMSRLAMALNNPQTMGRIGMGAGVATRLPELALRGYGVFGSQEPAK